MSHTGRLEVGVFVVPDAGDPSGTVEQIVAADEAGLDLVGVQDHPYQRRFLDTWTLLSYVAARTERIRLVPDVACLPLRPPAVLAKAAASLDALSAGRVELGLGAGAFWDAIEAMDGPRRSPGESVEALEEAIAVLRGWFGGERTLDVEGEHYRVAGAKPGPAPAHPIGLWIGAYGPRMLRLTGRLGDGWLPSAGPLDLAEAHERHRAIDEAAKRAGRDPAAIRRVLNAGVDGPPTEWADQLAPGRRPPLRHADRVRARGGPGRLHPSPRRGGRARRPGQSRLRVAPRASQRLNVATASA